MAAPTFPAIKPTIDSPGWSTSYTVYSSAFGDGYNQRTPQGLNSVRRSGTWHFSTTRIEDVNTITSFLDGLQGARPFRWTPPLETEELLLICPEGVEGPQWQVTTGNLVVVFETWFGAEE